MNAIIHIGTEKTGTTSLQLFLLKNSHTLLQQGVLFPKLNSTTKGNHYPLGLCCYSDDRIDEFNRGIPDWDAYKVKLHDMFKAEIKERNFDTLLLSSEHFQSRLTTESEILRLKQLIYSFGAKKISIILYLRDPACIAQSLYSTAMRVGHDWECPPPPREARMDILCNHKQTIEAWSRAYGSENVHPRLYLRDENKSFSIVNDFCGFINISRDNTTPIEDANTSISTQGCKLLQLHNMLIKRYENNQINPERESYVEFIENNFKGSYFMRAELRHEYDKAYNISNTWVKDTYFPERKNLFGND